MTQRHDDPYDALMRLVGALALFVLAVTVAALGRYGRAMVGAYERHGNRPAMIGAAGMFVVAVVIAALFAMAGLLIAAAVVATGALVIWTCAVVVLSVCYRHQAQRAAAELAQESVQDLLGSWWA